MSAKSDPRTERADSNFYYRRALEPRELLPAIGIGLAAGFAAFHLTRIWLQRTSIDARPPERARRGAGHDALRARGG